MTTPARFTDALVVVTGGAGFIGSHLVDALIREGAAVLVIDSLTTGDRNNLNTHEGNKDFTFWTADLTELDLEKADDIVRAIEFDRSSAGRPIRRRFVFNLASPASPVAYQRAAISTLRVGSEGTYRACRLAWSMGATFLQASTSEVYGQPDRHPQQESYWGNVNPVGPRSMYDEAKRYAEALVTSFRTTTQLDTRIARIHNTYGPRMQLDDGRVVPAFARSIALGEPLRIYGSGEQTRCFCFVSDMVEGLIRLALSKYQHPVNLGTEQEVTVNGFAHLMRSRYQREGRELAIEHHEALGDDPVRRRPNLETARRELDWEVLVDLATGLDLTMADVRRRLGQERSK